MPTTDMDTPLGRLRLVTQNDCLTRIEFLNDQAAASPARDPDALLARARAQIEEYFCGRRHSFDLPLAASGTRFQNQVWSALRGLAFGQTTSYGALARQIGRPQASRAVGAACGRNPLPIVVPCHRVLGQSGQLTGFAGGIDRKRWLLQHEAALPAR